MLFGEVVSQRFDLDDRCHLVYEPKWVGDRAEMCFAALRENVAWTQKQYRAGPMPRLTALYGEPGLKYDYSGTTNQALQWTPTLAGLWGKIAADFGLVFNVALLNLYRDGKDSVAWHSDDERGLGPSPQIASVSLGAVRKFVLRRKDRTLQKHTIHLAHGSLLLMLGDTQALWEHSIPKTGEPVGPRINVTFRRMV
jgi:hypothetical protein